MSSNTLNRKALLGNTSRKMNQTEKIASFYAVQFFRMAQVNNRFLQHVLACGCAKQKTAAPLAKKSVTWYDEIGPFYEYKLDEPLRRAANYEGAHYERYFPLPNSKENLPVD